MEGDLEPLSEVKTQPWEEKKDGGGGSYTLGLCWKGHDPVLIWD